MTNIAGNIIKKSVEIREPFLYSSKDLNNCLASDTMEM